MAGVAEVVEDQAPSLCRRVKVMRPDQKPEGSELLFSETPEPESQSCRTRNRTGSSRFRLEVLWRLTEQNCDVISGNVPQRPWLKLRRASVRPNFVLGPKDDTDM